MNRLILFAQRVLVLLSVLGVFYLTSCENDETEVDDEMYTLIKLTPAMTDVPYTVGVAGEEVTLNVSCPGDWSITADSDWFKLSPMEGSGDTELTLTVVKENPNWDPRTATIKVTYGFKQASAQIIQAKKERRLQLAAYSAEVEKEGVGVFVDKTAPTTPDDTTEPDAPAVVDDTTEPDTSAPDTELEKEKLYLSIDANISWKATIPVECSDWVQVTSNSLLEGDVARDIEIIVDHNHTTEARECRITIKDLGKGEGDAIFEQYFDISQKSYDPPTLVLEYDGVTTTDGDDSTEAITNIDIDASQESNDPFVIDLDSNTDWVAEVNTTLTTANTDWLTFTTTPITLDEFGTEVEGLATAPEESTSGTGDSKISIICEDNAGLERTVYIDVIATTQNTEKVRTIKLYQAGIPDPVTVTNIAVTLEKEAVTTETGLGSSVTILDNTEWTAVVEYSDEKNTDWLTITTPRTGTETTEFKYTITANATFFPRTATITVKAVDTTIGSTDKVITVTQNGDELSADAEGLYNILKALAGTAVDKMPEIWGTTNDITAWDGITATENTIDKVTAIELKDYDFNGGLTADEWQYLIGLEKLTLDGNSLTDLTLNEKLTSLKSINISNNKVTKVDEGTGAETVITTAIPESIITLTSLEEIVMANSSLTGTIPMFATTIKKIDLSNNELSGSIPEGYSEYTALEHFNVSNNDLTRATGGESYEGVIPAGFAKLPNLAYLNISGNQLKGWLHPDLFSTGSAYYNWKAKDNVYPQQIGYPADGSGYEYSYLNYLLRPNGIGCARLFYNYATDFGAAPWDDSTVTDPDYGFLIDLTPVTRNYVAMYFVNGVKIDNISSGNVLGYIGSGVTINPAANPTIPEELKLTGITKIYFNEAGYNGELPKTWYRTLVIINAQNCHFTNDIDEMFTQFTIGGKAIEVMNFKNNSLTSDVSGLPQSFEDYLDVLIAKAGEKAPTCDINFSGNTNLSGQISDEIVNKLFQFTNGYNKYSQFYSRFLEGTGLTISGYDNFDWMEEDAVVSVSATEATISCDAAVATDVTDEVTGVTSTTYPSLGVNVVSLANGAWTAEVVEGSDWFTLVTTEGLASKTTALKYTATENPSKEETRTAKIKVVSGIMTALGEEPLYIEVTQEKLATAEDHKTNLLENILKPILGTATAPATWVVANELSTWEGITVLEGENDIREITAINLPAMSFDGYIPTTIAELTSLETLDLSGNNLTGKPSSRVASISDGMGDILPASIATMEKLTALNVSGNKLEGYVNPAVLDNPNYTKWDAMNNILDQQTGCAISLNSVGIMKAFYYGTGGAWTDAEGTAVELNWATLTTLAKSTNYVGATTGEESMSLTTSAGIPYTGGAKISSIGGVYGLVGSLPSELKFTSGNLKSIDLGNSGISGTIDQAILYGVTALDIKNCGIAMDLSTLVSPMGSPITSLNLANNKLTGNYPESLISKMTTKVEDFSTNGNSGITGQMSDPLVYHLITLGYNDYFDFETRFLSGSATINPTPATPFEWKGTMVVDTTIATIDGTEETDHTLGVNITSTGAVWTAEVTSGSEWLSLTTTTGGGDGTVAEPNVVAMKYTAQENPSDVDSREATITITAEGCEDIVIIVTQDKYTASGIVKEILLDILTKLSGLTALDSTWSLDTDIMDWAGITATENKLNSITEINLTGKSLTGYVPSEISQLVNLAKLDLSGNNLTRNFAPTTDDTLGNALPVEMKDMVNLKEFNISGNKLEGFLNPYILDNPNYTSWNAWDNIFTQQTNPTDYDNTAASAYKFKLNTVGVMKALWYATTTGTTGERWTLSSGKEDVETSDDIEIQDPEWLDMLKFDTYKAYCYTGADTSLADVTITTSIGASIVLKGGMGIRYVGGAGTVGPNAVIGVTGVATGGKLRNMDGGEIPKEFVFVGTPSQYNTDRCGLRGKLPRQALSGAAYLNLQYCNLTNDLSEIVAGVGTDKNTYKFEGNDLQGTASDLDALITKITKATDVTFSHNEDLTGEVSEAFLTALAAIKIDTYTEVYNKIIAGTEMTLPADHVWPMEIALSAKTAAIANEIVETATPLVDANGEEIVLTSVGTEITITSDSDWLTVTPAEVATSNTQTVTTLNYTVSKINTFSTTLDAIVTISYTNAAGEASTMTLTVTIAAGDGSGDGADADILVDILDAIRGDVAADPSWTKENVYNDWAGITATGTTLEDITEIILPGVEAADATETTEAVEERKYNGYIPESIGQLTGLKVLTLSGNNLVGNPNPIEDDGMGNILPACIKDMTTLTGLSVQNNRFEGYVNPVVLDNPNFANWQVNNKLLVQQEGCAISFNSVGIMKAFYYGTGAAWTDAEGAAITPDWLNLSVLEMNTNYTGGVTSGDQMTLETSTGATYNGGAVIIEFSGVYNVTKKIPDVVGKVATGVTKVSLPNSGLVGISDVLVQRLSYLDISGCSVTDTTIDNIVSKLIAPIESLKVNGNAEITGELTAEHITKLYGESKSYETFKADILDGTGVTLNAETEYGFTPYIALSADTALVLMDGAAESTSLRVDVLSVSSAWTATSSEEWLTLETTSSDVTMGGEVATTLFYTALANDSGAERTATITVSNEVSEPKTITVTQVNEFIIVDTFDAAAGATEDAPIKISTANDLVALSAYYNAGGVEAGKFIKFEQNIDMSSVESFEPIGINAGKEFTGNIDGNDKRIDGLKITGENRLRAGLIGRFLSGSLKNLTVAGDINLVYNNPSSAATAMIGGIFGEATANNVIFSDEITSEVVINVNSTADDAAVLNVGGIGGNAYTFKIDDGAVLTYGKVSEASYTDNSTKTMAGINVVGGVKAANIGGIFGGYQASTPTVTMNVYAKEIKYTTSSGDAIANMGGITGTIKPANKLSASTFNVTSDLTMVYNGQNNDARSLYCGTLAGSHLATQTNNGKVSASNLKVSATSTSDSGTIVVSQGIPVRSSAIFIHGTTEEKATNAHLTIGTDTNVTYEATGGESQVINGVKQ